MRFGILNCKKVTLRLDQLDYKYIENPTEHENSPSKNKMVFKSRTKLRTDPQLYIDSDSVSDEFQLDLDN
tara:strand:- start:35 stop:244 length:210 start_codon:yes stop_codon:yes gene_type:complete